MSTVTAKTVREQSADSCQARRTRVCVCVCVSFCVFFLIVPFRFRSQFTSVAMLQVVPRILFSTPNFHAFQSFHAPHPPPAVPVPPPYHSRASHLFSGSVSDVAKVEHANQVARAALCLATHAYCFPFCRRLIHRTTFAAFLPILMMLQFS
jgi:hypothetical protein